MRFFFFFRSANLNLKEKLNKCKMVLEFKINFKSLINLATCETLQIIVHM